MFAEEIVLNVMNAVLSYLFLEFQGLGMEIGILCRTVYPIHGFGGAEKHVYYVAKGLAERGHEVHIYCLEADDASDEEYEDLDHENLVLHEVEYRDLGMGRLNFFEYVYLMRKNWDELDELDIVHSHGIFPITAYSYFHENDIVVTTHGLEEFRYRHLKIPLAPFNFFDKRAARKRVDRFIALSKGNREDQKRLLGIGDDVITEIPNGVDADFFQPSDTSEVEKRYDLRDNVVVAVSRLVEYKGHGLLVEAVNQMDDTSLVIAGDGPFKEELEEKAGEDVHFAGRVPEDELPLYYSLGDVFCLPTFGEGLPLSILESLSCGTPVLSTNVGSIPDVVTEDIGEVVEPEEVEELRKGLENLFDRDLEEMSGRCRKKALEEYSWDSVVEKTERVYEDLSS
ncbi:MAG: glycosyltransferase family 4 protein [Candidatus Nanohalobium sp.]